MNSLQHPFSNQKILFVTLHEKEKIVAPLFEALNMKIEVAKKNTDLLGTFSGEVDRPLSIRETLRTKINLGICDDYRFYLASEGSFGVHPLLCFGNSNLESLLFFDTQTHCEIYAEFLGSEVESYEKTYSDVNEFMKEVEFFKFPKNGIIVKPHNSFSPIFKGLHDLSEVKSAFEVCLKYSAQVKVMSDLRAHHNEARRKVIFNACEVLIQKLKSLCSQCNYPGFDIQKTIPGLTCVGCGKESLITKNVIFKCQKCNYELTQDRPDGKKFLDISECEECNP